METLADKIANAFDPTPKLIDPEDDLNFETKCSTEKIEGEEELTTDKSVLRTANAPYLSDIDARYAGRKIYRKDAFDQPEENPEDPQNDVESEASESEINQFKEQLTRNIDLSYSDGNDDSDEDSGSRYVSDDDDFENKSLTGTSSESELEKTNVLPDYDIVQRFSNIDVHEEMEKTKAVEAQQGLWNKFCAARIKLQKVISAANMLPQFDIWEDFQNNMNETCVAAHKQATNNLKKLLCSILELQSQLITSNPETHKICDVIDTPIEEKQSDEEIESDESEQEDIQVKNKTSPENPAVSLKRKLTIDEYEDILAKRHKAFIPYRNTVIQRWDDRTRLSTGKTTHKSFSAFDQPILKQIELILQDKQRLIRRTQLKRSVYHVLGKPEDKDQSEETLPKQNEHLKDYDPEIFDDDDFYRQFLKDVIESRACGIDPAMLRKHVEIQKLRSKTKRAVDTKASKARKTRFDVNPKFVNFMPFISTCTSTEEERGELFKSLFGGKKT